MNKCSWYIRTAWWLLMIVYIYLVKLDSHGAALIQLMRRMQVNPFMTRNAKETVYNMLLCSHVIQCILFDMTISCYIVAIWCDALWFHVLLVADVIARCAALWLVGLLRPFSVLHGTPNRTLNWYSDIRKSFSDIRKSISDIRKCLNFWYQKIIFWYLKINFWYQKIIFWYQKIGIKVLFGVP